jgi:hypothetical protein
VVRLGCDERQLDPEVAGERRVRHHAAQQPLDALRVELERVGKEVAGRLHQVRTLERVAVGGQEARRRLHDPPKRVLAGELHPAVM